jgi:hypothetical protein
MKKTLTTEEWNNEGNPGNVFQDEETPDQVF